MVILNTSKANVMTPPNHALLFKTNLLPVCY